MKRVKISLWIVIFLGGSLLNLSSCKNKSKQNQAPTINNEKDKGSNKATEEEIKYFFPTGRYGFRISQVGYFEKIDGYSYLSPWMIEGKNILDPKGKLLKELDIKNLFQISTIEGDPDYEGELFYKTKTKINTYKYYEIKEWYNLGFKIKHYCTKIQPEAVPKDLIFDDSFITRLYDKNGKIIDEHKMRNHVNMEDYKRDPVSKYNKLKDYGSTDASLIGMLKLPPKNQREGLKYRVLRLDKNGKPKPHLYQGAYKYPLEYYLIEEPLPPYSEYKNWSYYKKTGCYSTGGSPTPLWETRTE